LRLQRPARRRFGADRLASPADRRVTDAKSFRRISDLEAPDREKSMIPRSEAVCLRLRFIAG
jgi:hypothetical protein